MSLERMMARPLAVLQQAQQAVESSYSETHVQVYQLMADKLKACVPQVYLPLLAHQPRRCRR